MRLHHTAIAAFALSGLAYAEPAQDATKPAESVVGVKQTKMQSRYAPLFVEQKDAPTALKTARTENTLRFGQKPKD